MPRIKNMAKYYVPKAVYDAAMDDIHKLSTETKEYTFPEMRCHQTSYKTFSTHEEPLCPANILEAARQAWEDRNFKALYQIIHHGMDIDVNSVRAQMFEYLYAAIEVDPKIVNRDEVLLNTVMRFKGLKEHEAKNFIKNAHLLVVCNKRTLETDQKMEMMSENKDSDT